MSERHCPKVGFVQTCSDYCISGEKGFVSSLNEWISFIQMMQDPFTFVFIYVSRLNRTYDKARRQYFDTLLRQ